MFCLLFLKTFKQTAAKVIFMPLNEQDPKKPKETWECLNCGHENDEDTDICEICGAMRDTTYSSSGASLESDYGGDDLWDDDQGLM
jgi:hypothetical protein